ncbi:MAG: hypothetical protein IJJ33_19280 [Victivallales bacterium]|nr:hypothetical protein [Victivallales bacterium]
MLFDAAWSYYASAYYFKVYPVKKTILIYRNELDKKRFGSIHGKPSERLYRIDEELRYDGYSFEEIRDRLNGYDAVFVAGVHSRCRNGIAKYCKEKGIVGFFLPHVGDVIMRDALLDDTKSPSGTGNRSAVWNPPPMSFLTDSATVKPLRRNVGGKRCHVAPLSDTRKIFF